MTKCTTNSSCVCAHFANKADSDVFLSKGTSNEEMASHFFHPRLKYKNKEKPETGPIIICVFYNCMQLKIKQIIMAYM